jgi:sugar lactone lactonase YvrE
MPATRTLVCALVLTSFTLVNASAQSAARIPPRLTATIDLTIGDTNESREAYSFGAIDGLAMDAKGRIVVADAKDHNVRVFSAAGRYLYSIGRKVRIPVKAAT